MEKKTHIILISIPLFIITAFRDFSVGADTAYYMGARYSGAYTKNGEWGYSLLVGVFDDLNIEPRVYLIGLSAFFVYALGKLVNKYSEDPTLSYVVFVGIGFLDLFLNPLRQCISVCIFMLSIDLILNKKFFKYLFMMLIASTFHMSAIAFIPMYFLRYLKISRNYIKIALASLFLVYFFRAEILSVILKFMPGYEVYLTVGGDSLNRLLLIEAFVLCALSLFLFIYNNEGNEKSEFFVNLTLVYLIANVIATLTPIIVRLMINFAIGIMVCLPSEIKKMKPENYSLFIHICCVAIMILRFCIVNIDTNTGIIPYRFMWS